MANKSRRVGTEFENRLLNELRNVFGPGVDRAKAGNQSDDFHGAPLPIEAKRRKRWEIPLWVRKLRAVAPTNEWALFAASRDLRTQEGKDTGTVMVVDWHFGLELLDAYYNEDDDYELSRVDL